MNPTDEEIPLLKLLPLLHRLAENTNTRKEYGLTRTQINVLLALDFAENVSMGQIAQYIASSKEQATRTVAGLFEHGFVERFELPQNRTHVYIRLTESGRAFIHTYCETLNAEVREKIGKSLKEEEKVKLADSLHTVVELLSKVR